MINVADILPTVGRLLTPYYNTPLVISQKSTTIIRLRIRR